MKKVFGIIIFFVLILDVDALTNSGKLYEQYWQESNVNVFAASSVGTLDYNGWQVKSTIDDKIYYCIEPEIYMPNKNDTTVGTHKIYEGKNNIISSSRLDNDTYKKVNLLAYYGYMYDNHQDKKWYGITQTMIWQTLRSDITWSFKESRYGPINNNLYQKEVKELENLVNNHYLKPSFDNEKIELLLNEELVITDTNNVLKYFIIENNTSDFLVEKKDNKLIIKGLKEGIYDVSMIKKSNIGSSFALFSGGSYQDIVTRGEVDDVYSKFSIEVKMGEVILNKVDAETKENIPQGEALLNGAIYEIYDKDNNVVEQVIFDELTVFINLPFGTYYIKEKKAPVGYNLDEKTYEFELNSNNQKIHLMLEDYVIKAKYKIYKEKGSNEEGFVPEENAEFLITNKDNTFKQVIKTNALGEVEISLVYGTYLITQIKGSDGYELIKPYTITIDKNDDIEVKLQNLKKSKLIITKVDNKTKETLANAKIGFFYEDGTLYDEQITNDYGIIEIENISIGKYYIKEIEAPKGYILDEKKYLIEVKKNAEIIKTTLENKKFNMPNTYSNKIKNIKKIILLSIFSISTVIFTLSYVKKKN